MQMPGSCPTDSDTLHTSEEVPEPQDRNRNLGLNVLIHEGKHIKCEGVWRLKSLKDPIQPVGASLDCSLDLFSSELMDFPPCSSCACEGFFLDTLVSLHRLRL